MLLKYAFCALTSIENIKRRKKAALGIAAASFCVAKDIAESPAAL